MQNGPNSSRLQGPEEEHLLAWIEGEPLSPEANAAVARALLADPTLARRMELMRADRLALQSLGAEERAPAGLIAAVEAALQPVLEREVLLGLKDGEPESLPVVSLVRPEKRGVFQTFLADRAGRRMALAASLLVLIGGATWWGTVMMSGGNQPKIGPIANNNPALRAIESTPEKPADKAPDEGLKIALNEPKRGGGEAAMMKAATPEHVTPPGPAALAFAPGEVVGPVRTPMDAALAADLAREKRLVIRLVSREATSSPRRLCDRVKKECNSTAWKLASNVPPDLTVALDAKPLEVGPPSRIEQPEAPVLAASEFIEPIMGPPAPPEAITIPESEPQPVYLVQARLDAATMSQLKASLERAGREEVVFEERYEPLPLADNTPITPQSMFWWSGPPAGWTSWGEVPVVIEPK